MKRNTMELSEKTIERATSEEHDSDRRWRPVKVGTFIPHLIVVHDNGGSACDDVAWSEEGVDERAVRRARW